MKKQNIRKRGLIDLKLAESVFYFLYKIYVEKKNDFRKFYCL